jgi:undecaprenyl diphosphate synthase
MRLFRGYLQNKFLSLVENNVKVKFLGDPSPLARELVLQMRNLERVTEANNGLHLNIALNYGGRDEILRATRNIADAVSKNELNLSEITTEKFESYLDTKGQNSPDFIIRTAGEQRISNFMLWQSAYSEFFFSHLNWPDFNKNHFADILERLSGRSRTYGKNKLVK